MAAKMMGISEDDLTSRLLEWSDHIKFQINKGSISVDNMDEFIKSLDSQFSDWIDTESSKEGKT